MKIMYDQNKTPTFPKYGKHHNQYNNQNKSNDYKISSNKKLPIKGLSLIHI